MDTTKGMFIDKTWLENELDTRGAFSRRDETDDKVFYEKDRFVSHLDATALETVENVIGDLIVEDKPVILDLMAGWDSHIPDSVKPAKVVGLGMNFNELERNEAIDEYVIHNLNKNPKLPFDDNTFDVVLNTVSVDYLTRPIEVFEEIGRVLKPGGLLLVIFSNRFFPGKVVRIWEDATEKERIALVREYFRRAGVFGMSEVFISMGKPRPDDDKYAYLGVPSDPIFAVYADKKTADAFTRQRIAYREDGKTAMDPEELKRRKKEIKHTLECPYCGGKLGKWRVPDNPFVEWPNEFMYLCFNDACPYLERGWRVMFEQGNRTVSYRFMYNPDNDCTLAAPVYTFNDLKEGIVE